MNVYDEIELRWLRLTIASGLFAAELSAVKEECPGQVWKRSIEMAWARARAHGDTVAEIERVAREVRP